MTFRRVFCAVCQSPSLSIWPHDTRQFLHLHWSDVLDSYVHPSCVEVDLHMVGKMIEVDMGPLRKLIGLDELAKEYTCQT